MNKLEQAIVEAAERGAPPKTFEVDRDADVTLGVGRNALDGMLIIAWDVSDVLTGRSE